MYRVGILYAPADEPYMLQLHKHLTPLIRDGVDVWHAGQIAPGSDRSAELRAAIHRADILLVLVSADYISTNECYSNEIYGALASHTKILVAVVRSCDWRHAPFGHLPHVLHKESDNPISAWTNPDDAWAKLAAIIRSTLEEDTTDLTPPFIDKYDNRSERCRPHERAALEIANHKRPSTIQLREFNTIGRSSRSNITLIHPSVSRLHCIIFLHEGGFFVHDLRSRHGTTINGRKVKLADGLRHRDHLRIGNVEARFLIFNDQSTLSATAQSTHESSIEVVWDDETQPSG
ncbi:FHA domain-containing protein [Sorangium cellulosum]|uniref:FHA domain-containing protein n=1 Tax=Sorangium cellulosum TaxID=56 RepID=A0A150QQV1_SORCE|nr:FHA domain-containing protein [Sorangium cellulosum]KYF70340.1 hypothetical protein BE15_15185 [Sorangium cellulosum]